VQIDAGDAQDHAARAAQGRVTARQQGCGLVLGMTQDGVRGETRGRRGLLAVTDAVDGRYERATTAVIAVHHSRSPETRSPGAILRPLRTPGSGQPFRDRHRGAAAGAGGDVKLVHQAPDAGQPQARPPELE